MQGEAGLTYQVDRNTLLYFGTSEICAVRQDKYGPGSSFGIATELRTGRAGERIPVGRDFPPVRTVRNLPAVVPYHVTSPVSSIGPSGGFTSSA
jgi:hypothetical protein